MPRNHRLVAVCSVLPFLMSPAWALTIETEGGAVDLVAPGATWRFLPGRQTPPADWSAPDFDDTTWNAGPAGFGYGDGDDATVLDDMRGAYVTVYLRRAFEVDAAVLDRGLALTVDYDDGFVAYLNGREVARRSLPTGPLDAETRADSHEAGSPETLRLGPAADWLVAGRNVLAVEGHNVSRTSSDFSLHPSLATASSQRRIDTTWIVETPQVSLQGRTEQPDAVAVTLGSDAAAFDSETGRWSGRVPLTPGLNRIRITALDAAGVSLESAEQDVVYLPPENHLSGGLLDPNSLWSGAVALAEPVVVGPNDRLTIAPDTWVLLGEDARITVQGQLIADGNEGVPIRFTHAAEGAAWKQLRFESPATSRLSYCLFEYADSAGAHQDYYEPGPRDYHEAVVVLRGHLDLDHCSFQRLSASGKKSEGDALAVISDDANLPGPASAVVRDCNFIGIGQGVHTRFSHVLVEGCFFTAKHGDNDDVDLYGESASPSVIRHNRFLDPDHDDMINPTRCSAIIEGNILRGSDDHGIVLRDRCFPVVTNNLIIDCAHAGIAVENTCEALIVNNTLIDCGRGIRLLDLGRWGPPYRLAPGGGTATVINCLFWDCPQPITLADSSNHDIADRGSHVTVQTCNLPGGVDGVSVGGSQSTLTWGEGNVDLEPGFVDAAAEDFHLRPDSSLIDRGRTGDAPPVDLDGCPRPAGSAADIGAYEAGACPAE